MKKLRNEEQHIYKSANAQQKVKGWEVEALFHSSIVTHWLESAKINIGFKKSAHHVARCVASGRHEGGKSNLFGARQWLRLFLWDAPARVVRCNFWRWACSASFCYLVLNMEGILWLFFTRGLPLAISDSASFQNRLDTFTCIGDTHTKCDHRDLCPHIFMLHGDILCVI